MDSGDEVDAGVRLKRMRDEADFEQVDILQHPACRMTAKPARPIAETQAVGAAGEQFAGGTRLRVVDPGNYAQAAFILLRAFDYADLLVWPVLPVERNWTPATCQSPGKRTSYDDVFRAVGNAE